MVYCHYLSLTEKRRKINKMMSYQEFSEAKTSLYDALCSIKLQDNVLISCIIVFIPKVLGSEYWCSHWWLFKNLRQQGLIQLYPLGSRFLKQRRVLRSYGKIFQQKGRVKLQRIFTGYDKQCTETNKMKYNKSEWKVLYLTPSSSKKEKK